MNSSFLMLLAAAGILRYLAAQAKRAFDQKLCSLLPRHVMSQHLKALFANHPEQFAAFRRRVLPFSGLHIVMNALACGGFVAALWWFPPAAMSEWDLFFMRYGSLLLVPIAFAVDLWSFGRMLLSTLTIRDELDGQS